MQETSDSDFVRFYEAADNETREVVDAAVAHGLAYQSYPSYIYNAMVSMNLPIDLITDEIERQLAEMPSLSLN